MSKVQRLSDTGPIGRLLSEWFDTVGVRVVSLRASRHWRVKLEGPSGRQMTLTVARSPLDDQNCFNNCRQQVCRGLDIPRDRL